LANNAHHAPKRYLALLIMSRGGAAGQAQEGAQVLGDVGGDELVGRVAVGDPTGKRSTNILLIPGTSSAAHLRENVAGAGLSLSDDELAELNRIGRR